MAYNNFTLEAVEKEFELELVEHAGIFSEIEPVGLSAELTNVLACAFSDHNKHRKSPIRDDYLSCAR